MRTPITLELSRINASTRENIRPFFQLLLSLFCLRMYHQSNIYNFDETSLRLDEKQRRKVLCKSSASGPFLEEPSYIYSSTAGFCVSATGKALKSCLILKKDFPPYLLKDFDDQNTSIFTSENGWMTKRLVKYHMLHNIIPQIVERLRHQFASSLFTFSSYNLQVKQEHFC